MPLDLPSKSYTHRELEVQSGREPVEWVVDRQLMWTTTVRNASLVVRLRSFIDQYDLDLTSLMEHATSVVYSFLKDARAVVVPASTEVYETWLPEVGALPISVESSPQMVGSVPKQVTSLRQFMGLTDSEFAAMFPRPVARETVNRWRNLVDVNIKPRNAYRLGLLVDLADAMKAAGIDAKTWLRQPLEGRPETPYDLICAGRLADVRQAVEAVKAKLHQAREPMYSVEFPTGHDSVVEDEDDDGAAWTWERAEDD